MSINPADIKKDFPILNQEVNGRPLVYLDNAATTQKPQVVIDEIARYLSKDNANAHRSVHALGERSTKIMEDTRKKTQVFLGATVPEEIVFTKNCTEAINLVAFSWGLSNINEGDEILLSKIEHHSNLVPWQMVAKVKNAKLKFIPLNADGTWDLRNIKGLINENTKLIALNHVSNFLGTINPVEEVIKLAKKDKIPVLLDGAQSASCMPINVQKLGVSFFAFSAHKMLGPTGVGVLYVNREMYKDMSPFMFGGDMIRSVSLEDAQFARPPQKYEAGTPNVVGLAGFSKALDYLQEIGLENILKHEQKLHQQMHEIISELDLVEVYGPRDPKNQIGVFTFNIKGIHSHDLATVLDEEGVAVRSGHHCAMPAHFELGISASTRASFYVYNTEEDIIALVKGIKEAKKTFSL